MSRQYANKFNEVLLLRTKKRVEDFHKPTGITKLMERNEGINRKDFDKFYKDHVIEGIKSRNIRGLFRVPDDDKHLVVDAQEDKDDKEDKPSEQKMQVPFRDEIQIPSNIDDMQVPHNRAMVYYPLRRPKAARREEEVQMVEEEGRDLDIFKPNTGEERAPIIRSGEERRRVDKCLL